MRSPLCCVCQWNRFRNHRSTIKSNFFSDLVDRTLTSILSKPIVETTECLCRELCKALLSTHVNYHRPTHPIPTHNSLRKLSTLAARGNCEPALSSTTHSRPVSTTTIVLYLAHFLTSLATRHPTRATSRSTITLSGADVPPPSLHSFIVPIGPAVTPFRHPSIHCPPPFYSLSSAASTHTQRVDYFRSTPAPGQQLYIYTPYSP